MIVSLFVLTKLFCFLWRNRCQCECVYLYGWLEIIVTNVPFSMWILDTVNTFSDGLHNVTVRAMDATGNSLTESCERCSAANDVYS